MAQKWVKHTINLVHGSDLDMKFKMSANKAHMVRHVFKRAAELREEVLMLREENQVMLENIAKFQARLNETPEMELHEGQTTFQVETENEKWIREQKELNEE